MSTGEQQPPDWNPYQQPGYHQDNPYQHATVPMDKAGAAMPPQGPGADKSHKTKMTLAIVASIAMVVAVTVGGFVLVGGSDTSDDPPLAQPAGDGDEDDGEEDPDGEDGDGDDGDEDDKPSDPRGGTKPQFDPVVADDWNVQAIADRGIIFDVPPDWKVESTTMQYMWEINIEGEELEEGEDPGMLSIRGPGASPQDECGNNPAVVGTTGELGATDTAAAAENSAFQYVLGVYDNNQRGTRKDVAAEPFSNDHGFEGHIASATVEGFPLSKDRHGEEQENECHPPGGKVVVVSYVTPSGDLASWLAITDTGVDGELDDETIEKMTGSLRPFSTE
jgi:hypothetical protein